MQLLAGNAGVERNAAEQTIYRHTPHRLQTTLARAVAVSRKTLLVSPTGPSVWVRVPERMIAFKLTRAYHSTRHEGQEFERNGAFKDEGYV